MQLILCIFRGFASLHTSFAFSWCNVNPLTAVLLFFYNVTFFFQMTQKDYGQEMFQVAFTIR